MVETLTHGANALFILLGGIMVLAMHAGFAFLELGTVRHKNQVNALVKILVDFSVSTIVYFVIGYYVAYGEHFFVGAETLANLNGYALVKFFFLLTFAAAIPAIISGGIAERSKFWPQLIATAAIVGFFYPFFEGIVWNRHFGFQEWLLALTGFEFHDFAGSVVVISHDRYFISKVATSIVAIEDKKLTKYEGDYKFYMEKSKYMQEKIEARYVQGVARIESAPIIDVEALQKPKGNFGGAKTAGLVTRKDKGIKNAKRMAQS